MSGKKPPRPLPDQRRPQPSVHPPRVPRPRTGEPDAEPTERPTERPTEQPTEQPSQEPSRVPALEPTGTAPPEEPLSRPAVPVLVLATLLLAAVLGAGTWLVLRGEPGPGPSATSEPVAVPSPPVPLARDSAYVESVVDAAGDVTVRHWIRGRGLLFGVELSTPAPYPPGSAPVTARTVRVVAGGTEVPGPRRVRENAFYAFVGEDEVFVTYRLEGAVELTGSVPGRGLARATSLVVDISPGLGRSTRTVAGAEVLNLACRPSVGSEGLRPCGERAEGGWQVLLTGDRTADQVVAQLNLS